MATSNPQLPTANVTWAVGSCGFEVANILCPPVVVVRVSSEDRAVIVSLLVETAECRSSSWSSFGILVSSREVCEMAVGLLREACANGGVVSHDSALHAHPVWVYSVSFSVVDNHT